MMELDEIVRRFSLDRINKKSAVFDTEKLEWLNGQHLGRMPPEQLEPLVTDRLVASGLAAAEDLAHRREWYLGLITLLRDRARTVDDLVVRARPFLADTVEYEEKAVRKHWSKSPDDVAERLRRLRALFASQETWEEQPLEDALRALADGLGVGAGKLIHPLRVALTGSAVSPGIFEVLVVMGRDRTLDRLDAAIPRVEALQAA
ncbi:MAG: hypothetical protein GWM90_20000 [Gemmatimonadetes bacterium]|nr:hypothetical protein [Gemmatimonadota bacterium]NIU76913.1 hypothetical protein [Gammaproteobacteria bacterium]NIX46284.1 hypothetical protein [Gemmatimonadota bacterium]